MVEAHDAFDQRRLACTVFAKQRVEGAGRDIDRHMIERCEAAGASIAPITLHVGLGTFQPLSTDDVTQVTLHGEQYDVTESSATRMQAARRLIAVGTTSLRTLESAGLKPGSGVTTLFIAPGYEFRHARALLTNFHLPGTSLLLLVAAFAGVDLTRRAYAHAVHERYRFYFYGDCMLVI